MRMASMDPEKMRIQDFGGDDKKWLTWKLKFKALLQHHKLAYLLKPGASRPSGEDRVAWDADSEDLYAKLVWYTADTALDLVNQFQDKEDNGVRAWKALEDKYERKDITRMTALHGELFNSALGEAQDPDQYFVKIEDIQRQLREMGDEVTNDSLRGIVMSKLPANYAILKPSLRSNKSLDYDTLKSEIQQHYREEIAAKQKIDIDDSNVALPVKFTGQCFGCGKVGHRRWECRQKHSGNRFSSGSSERPGNGKSTHYRVTCYYCKKAGHVKTDCPQLKGNSQKFSLTAVETKAALTLGQVKKNTWVVDSGCTSHMSESTEGVINLHRRISEVRVGGGAKLTAIGVGQMKVWAHSDAGSMVTITLNDVLIVPGLGYNLLSVDRIRSKGGTVYFNGLKNYIELGECIRIPIKPVGGLFEVKLRPQRERVDNMPKVLAMSSLESLWHRRLGHRNHADMKKMSMMNLGVPEGLKPSGKCKVCEVGKHTHRSFPRKTKRRSTTPMEVVHTDIYGPVDEDSIGGSKYAVMFTDDATRWRMIYFMNSKSETLTKFKQFVADVSRLLGGLKMKRIHSDNGKEFLSKEFRTFCAEEGIKQTTSGNYAPQQNGTAERGWRTIGNMATCLLENAELGTDLWAEAMNYAVYITNRVPTPTLGGETPYFALFGRQANLSNLKVFGCSAYVQKTKIKQKKLESKAWTGVMVGCDDNNRTCYRIYDPVNNLIKKEVHVTFDESVMYQQSRNTSVSFELKDNLMEDIVSTDKPQERVVGESDQSSVVPASVGATPSAEAPTAEATQLEETTNTVGVQGEQETQAMRRSTRTKNPTTCQIENCERGSEVHRAHLNVHHALLAALDIRVEPGVEPRTYKDAIESKDSAKWQTAMDEEYGALNKLETWELVKATRGMKILKNMWVFKTKLNSSGKIARYKARLVVKGFAQEAGIDFNETFAPVAKTKTILIVLAIAAVEDWYLFNMDVDTAFLNSPVDEEIYMCQPEGYEEYGPDGEQLVCKLKKSLYGLKQAPRNWNLMIDQWLVEYEFMKSTADPCMYVMNGDSGKILIVVLYVDDLMIAGNDLELIDQFKVAIAGKFTMKDLGELRWMLGMEVKRDRTNRVLEVNQTMYIKQVLERFGMADCKPVATPMEGTLSRCTENKNGFDYEFARLVGSVLYIAVISRPDIAYAVQCLGRQMQATTKEHWTAAKRLLRYLQGTKNQGIKFGGQRVHEIKLVGYCDADWGNDKETRRSTTGYVFILGGGGVSWCSKLQHTVALSSTEAEYMALCAGTQEAIFLRRLLKEVGYDPKEATTLREDNQGCIALSENPINYQRTKHIDIRYHFIREKVESGEVTLKYIPTEHQLADLLTKHLNRPRIEYLRNQVLGVTEVRVGVLE